MRRHDERGQSSLEYLLVLLAFAAMAAALAALWHAGRDGALVRLATEAASHGAGQGGLGMLRDVLAF